MDGVNQPTFFRTNRPTREFQDDSDGTASMPELGRNQVTHVQCSALQQQMMAALVEVICLQIENGDPQKAKQLYKKVCQQLKRLKIMLPIANISEFSMVQHQCKKAIYSLICKTSDKLHRETRNRFLPGTLTEKVEAIFLQPNLRLTAQPSAVETFFFPNRYRDEFEHMEKIGKGAYGAVNKVKHKLDGVQYAIKLVKFPVRAEKVRKVTREVRHLSTLTHRHIVRYYGAWIENDFLPLICNDTEHVISHSGIEENIPALDEPMRLDNIQQAQGLDIDRDQDDMSEGSDSVQFKDSSQVTDLVPRVPPYSAAHLSINGESQHSENQASYNGDSYSEDPTNQQIFTQTSTLYIQMELCETNLKDWLSDRNNRHAEDPFEVSKVEICHILKQILEAVEYIHSKDLIHRDLKPHNIFINQVGGSLDIKLGDFGLSRQIQASSFSVAATAPVTRSICRELLTPHPGAAEGFDWTLYTKGVGTTIYAAPEQLQGNDYSNKSDMYSLGLIAYELWCPFHTETERRICLSKIRTESLPQVFKEKWPSESEFIEKLLHKDPSVRPSARDLLNSQLFLTTDQIITNLCSELDKLKDENLSLKGQLRAKGEELQRKDLEIERLKLQVLSLDESVKQLKRDPR